MKRNFIVGYFLGVVSWLLITFFMFDTATTFSDDFLFTALAIVSGAVLLLNVIRLFSVNKLLDMSIDKFKVKTAIDAVLSLLGILFILIGRRKFIKENSYGEDEDSGIASTVILIIIQFALLSTGIGEIFFDTIWNSGCSIIFVVVGSSMFITIAGLVESKGLRIVLSILAIIGYLFGSLLSVPDIVAGLEVKDVTSAVVGASAIIYSIIEIAYLFFKNKKRGIASELITIAISVGISFVLEITGILNLVVKIVRIVACIVYLGFLIELFVGGVDIATGLTQPMIDKMSNDERSRHERNESYNGNGVRQHYYIKHDGRWTYVYIDKRYANDIDVIHEAENEASASGANPNYTTVKYY